MKIFKYILVVLVCNILNGQSLNSLISEKNGFDYERLSRLSNKLDEFSKKGILPGSVVLISKNDEILRVDPNSLDTLLHPTLDEKS